MRPQTLLALLFLLAAAPASAHFASNFAVAGLVPLSMPLEPMKQGRWDISISPAYVKMKVAHGSSGDKDLSAWGGAGSAVRGLSEHFGVGLTALGFSGSGDYVGPGLPPSYSVAAYPVKISGGLFAVSGVWDAFTGSEFRFPVLAGIHYESLSETIDYAPGSNEKTELSSPGWQLGLSPQWNTGPLRWEPFFMVYFPMNHAKQSVNGTSYNTIRSDAGPQPGLNLLYRPWNLGLFWTLGAGKAKGTHTYSLRWKKTLG